MDYEMAEDAWLDSYLEDRLGGGDPTGVDCWEAWNDTNDYDDDYEDGEW